MFADHLDLQQRLWWTVDDVLPADRCAAYIQKLQNANAQDVEQAPVITKGGVEIDLAVRNNTRVMWDDQAEANALVALLGDKVPRTWKNETLVGGNPRLRLYRYEPGQHHSAHWDTVVELGDSIRSRLTLVFYLNDDFTGGQTDFPELAVAVAPKMSRALVFQHRVLHSATSVVAGAKYVLRTDILYRGAS